MKRIATQIQWETDGEEVELPDRIEIPGNIDDDGIADYLSDKTGFLHNGFNIEQSIDLYMVEETDAWHSRNSATPMGLYHSKDDAIEAILKHHNIDTDELIVAVGYDPNLVLGKDDEYPAEPEEPIDCDQETYDRWAREHEEWENLVTWEAFQEEARDMLRDQLESLGQTQGFDTNYTIQMVSTGDWWG
jgi:hypothetical protein